MSEEEDQIDLTFEYENGTKAVASMTKTLALKLFQFYKTAREKSNPEEKYRYSFSPFRNYNLKLRRKYKSFD